MCMYMCMCTKHSKQDTDFGHLRPFKPPWMFDVWGSWGSRFWFQVPPPEIAFGARSGWPQAQGCEECHFMSFWLTKLEGPPRILEVGIWVDQLGFLSEAMCQGLLQGLFDGQAGACGAGPWTSMKNASLSSVMFHPMALLSGWWMLVFFFFKNPYFPQPDWGWWSNLTFIFFRVETTNQLSLLIPSDADYMPSGNQTWQWTILRLQMIYCTH